MPEFEDSSDATHDRVLNPARSSAEARSSVRRSRRRSRMARWKAATSRRRWSKVARRRRSTCPPTTGARAATASRAGSRRVGSRRTRFCTASSSRPTPFGGGPDLDPGSAEAPRRARRRRRPRRRAPRARGERAHPRGAAARRRGHRGHRPEAEHVARGASPETGTRMSRGPAARKSGTSKPPVRRTSDGTPSSSSRPWMSSASAWWRAPATRTSRPSAYCGLDLARALGGLAVGRGGGRAPARGRAGCRSAGRSARSAARWRRARDAERAARRRVRLPAPHRPRAPPRTPGRRRCARRARRARRPAGPTIRYSDSG